MGPLLGPLAGALLAAVGAGIVLGVVRLRRISLAWWRHRADRLAPASGPGAGAPARPGPPPADESGENAAAPPVFAALAAVGCTTLVLALIARTGAAPLPRVIDAAAPAGAVSWLGQLPGLAGFAVLVVAATLGLALFVSALDVAVALLFRRLVPPGALDHEPPLTVPDLLATARRFLPDAPAPSDGEPFGVGLAYVVLFSAAALGVGALLAACDVADRRSAAGLAGLAALGLLATPAAYAAAAERSLDPLRARLRRDAAVRQLIAAPAWLLAAALLALFAGIPGTVGVAAGAGFVLALAGAAALPGALALPGVGHLPEGGDRAEPVAVVRALSGLAHYAWIAVGATIPFVAPVTERQALIPALGASGLALVGFLAARTMVVRLRARRPIGVAA